MTDVVLLHAYPLDRRMWEPQAEFLARIGHRVFTPDYGGFGDSTLPDEASMSALAAQVLAQVSESAVFAGCSMGGYVLMEIIRQAPERVAAAIFVDTKATADTDEARANRHKVADDVIAAGNTAALADAMLPNLLGATTREQRAHVIAQVRGWIEQADPRAAALAQRAMADRPDSRPTLNSYEGPALVVWGAQDTISPKVEQEQFFAVMPQAVGREIETSGHLPSVETPDLLNDILLEVLSDWVG